MRARHKSWNCVFDWSERNAGRRIYLFEVGAIDVHNSIQWNLMRSFGIIMRNVWNRYLNGLKHRLRLIVEECRKDPEDWLQNHAKFPMT